MIRTIALFFVAITLCSFQDVDKDLLNKVVIDAKTKIKCDSLPDIKIDLKEAVVRPVRSYGMGGKTWCPNCSTILEEVSLIPEDKQSPQYILKAWVCCKEKLYWIYFFKSHHPKGGSGVEKWYDPISLESDGKDFEVHEWGVFMMYQGIGADLVASTSYDDLPDFVIRREKIKEDAKVCPRCKQKTCACDLYPPPTLYKPMKPIINFYSKEKLNVSVGVGYPRGVFSVWYPKHTTLSNSGADISWKELTITPNKPEKGIRNPKGSSWWDIARDTDSAYVVTKDGDAEKFIFYEGESKNMPLDLEVKVKDGKVLVKAKNKFKSVFVINGKKIAWFKELEGCLQVDFKEIIEQKEAMKKLERMLIDQGMFEKEAVGIAKIWEKEFFENDGVRVIVMMSRSDVDKALPIQITPKPKKLARAMLACVNDTDSLVQSLLKKLASDDPPTREAATQALIRMGKAIETIIKDAIKNEKDPEVKSR